MMPGLCPFVFRFKVHRKLAELRFAMVGINRRSLEP